MEHKGGRIKEHRRQEEPQGQEDWLDVEWLDEEEETEIRIDEPEGLHTDGMSVPEQEEQLEIEDWRDEENWNLTDNSREDKLEMEKPLKKVADEKTSPVSEETAQRSSSQNRPGSQGESRPRKKRPVQKKGTNSRPTARSGRKGSRAGDSRRNQQDKKQKRADRKQKVQAAARPVRAAGRAAGKAGKTAGKAVGRGICIAMKCGCFLAMAVIVLEFWHEFWAERSTLGEIWRVAADRNYAQGLYLGIAGVILLYGVLSAIWLLGGKKMPDGNRLKTFDTGRGLTAFILFAVLVAAAGFVMSLLPESPQALDGVRLALTVADRIKTVVLGCCVVGVALCILRKVIGR